MKNKFQLTPTGYAFALLIPLFLMLPFQNCTKTEFSSNKSDSTTQSSNSGNAFSGGNYDGKPFIHSEPNNTCTGGSPVRSVIVFKDGKYTLVMSDCSALAPAHDVPASDIQNDATRPAILTYKSKKFIFDATTLAASPASLTCVKKNSGPVDSLKIYLLNGPSGTMMTGFVVGSGKTTVLAFDKTVLNTSANSVLSGQSQESEIYAVLSKFDPQARHPDGTNTAIAFDYGAVGSNSWLSCNRPGGGL